jgi:hypothetical protein
MVVRYRCTRGHLVEQAWGSLQQKGRVRCPRCATSPFGETLTRIILEHLTRRRWPKARPSWAGMELDGYCAPLRAAFEFDGKQHFEKIDAWEAAGESLATIKRRDKRKTLLCKRNGVRLLRVPYYEFDNHEKMGAPSLDPEHRYDALVAWFASQLSRLAIACPNRGTPLIVDIRDLHGDRSDFNLKRCLEYARQHQGDFLSQICTRTTALYPWKSKTHGVFLKSLNDVMNGHWCPECGRTRSAESRRKRFPSVDEWRHECRRLGVDSQASYHNARKTGAFYEAMPAAPTETYCQSWLQLFQKARAHGEPWQCK